VVLGLDFRMSCLLSSLGRHYTTWATPPAFEKEIIKMVVRPMAEHLPSLCKALGSIPSTGQNKNSCQFCSVMGWRQVIGVFVQSVQSHTIFCIFLLQEFCHQDHWVCSFLILDSPLPELESGTRLQYQYSTSRWCCWTQNVLQLTA
jgi:hypothetical protein